MNLCRKFHRRQMKEKSVSPDKCAEPGSEKEKTGPERERERENRLRARERDKSERAVWRTPPTLARHSPCAEPGGSTRGYEPVRETTGYEPVTDTPGNEHLERERQQVTSP